MHAGVLFQLVVQLLRFLALSLDKLLDALIFRSKSGIGGMAAVETFFLLFPEVHIIKNFFEVFLPPDSVATAGSVLRWWHFMTD